MIQDSINEEAPVKSQLKLKVMLESVIDCTAKNSTHVTSMPQSVCVCRERERERDLYIDI